MNAESHNHAIAYLKKAEDCLASAEDNLALERSTPAAGDAIHAGISAKDAIVTELTGRTSKAKDHAAAAKELRQALGQRTEAATAEQDLRRLVSMKSEVEYGAALVTLAKAQQLVPRAQSLVELAQRIVRLGG